MANHQNLTITDYFPTIGQLKSFRTKKLNQLFRYLQPSANSHKLSRTFLLGNLAWHLQVMQSAADPKLVRKSLLKRIEKQKSYRKPKYLPGTRLVREWKGITHEVVIEDKGYRWRKQHYRSLSHIAREITGTNWSGPRFFGLKS